MYRTHLALPSFSVVKKTIDKNVSYFISIVSPSGNGGQSGNLLGLLLGQPGPQGPIYVDNNNNIGPNGCPGNEPSDCAQPRCSERLRQARVSASALRVFLSMRLTVRCFWQWDTTLFKTANIIGFLKDHWNLNYNYAHPVKILRDRVFKIINKFGTRCTDTEHLSLQNVSSLSLQVGHG